MVRSLRVLLWWLPLCLALALAQDSQHAGSSGRSAHSSTLPGIPAKKVVSKNAGSMFSGISVQRHVSTKDLPEDKVVFVCEAHYRLIGPDAHFSKVESSGLKEAILATWGKMNSIAKFETRIELRPPSLAPGSVEDPCGIRETTEDCFLRSFGLAENYPAVDVIIHTGVKRNTQFPDIGEKEWTYNRMLETMLRQSGFETRVVIRHMRVTPAGVHVFKHVPFTALYSEETMFQLEGLELLPLNLAKQNLLLAALDCVGLNNVAGVGWLEIGNLSEAWHWTPHRGDVGVANITLHTMRDRTGISMGEALAGALQRLLDRMDEVGLPRVHGKVLWSRMLSGHSPQDQIAALLGPKERVKSYDLRGSVQIPPYPPRPKSNLWMPVTVLAALATVACVAGVMRLQRHQSTNLPPSPFQGEAAAMTFFGRTLTSLKGRPAAPLPRLRSGGSTSSGRGLDSRSGSLNPFREEVGRRAISAARDGSAMSWSDDIKDLGDSATETAGLEGLSEAKRRAQIRMQLEKASSLKGWEIEPSAISFCKRDDGSDWLLGSGGFGQVYKGLRSGVQDVAVKVLAYSEELEMQQFWVEINLLKSLSFDRNIVQFYGVVLDESYPMLILELMEGGDLRNALSSQTESTAWYREGQSLALDIVRGICYLHENKVIHGDLKSKNVLLTRNWASAKLSDVGMSRVLASTLATNDNTRGPIGTFAYAAPELLLGQRSITFKADIFSLGVTIWEIVTHDVPIRGQMRSVKVPDECPESISQLIDRCLLPSPEDRPTAKEVFEILKAEQTGQSNERRDSLNSSGKLRYRPHLKQVREAP